MSIGTKDAEVKTTLTALKQEINKLKNIADLYEKERNEQHDSSLKRAYINYLLKNIYKTRTKEIKSRETLLQIEKTSENLSHLNDAYLNIISNIAYIIVLFPEDNLFYYTQMKVWINKSKPISIDFLKSNKDEKAQNILHKIYHAELLYYRYALSHIPYLWNESRCKKLAEHIIAYEDLIPLNRRSDFIKTSSKLSQSTLSNLSEKKSILSNPSSPINFPSEPGDDLTAIKLALLSITVDSGKKINFLVFYNTIHEKMFLPLSKRGKKDIASLQKKITSHSKHCGGKFMPRIDTQQNLFGIFRNVSAHLAYRSRGSKDIEQYKVHILENISHDELDQQWNLLYNHYQNTNVETVQSDAQISSTEPGKNKRKAPDADASTTLPASSQVNSESSSMPLPPSSISSEPIQHSIASSFFPATASSASSSSSQSSSTTASIQQNHDTGRTASTQSSHL